MAAPIRIGWSAIAGVTWLLLAGIILPLPGHAADPGASPGAAATTGPRTCSERYPADGPAGVDLLLGCVVGELVGHYTGAGAGPGAAQRRISAYAVPIAAGAVGIVLLLLAIRAVTRGVGRRLAPAAPTAWWSCPACRSLNAAGTAACYACGNAFDEGATEMRADAEPPAPQSFGRRDDY